MIVYILVLTIQNVLQCFDRFSNINKIFKIREHENQYEVSFIYLRYYLIRTKKKKIKCKIEKY